MRPHSLRLKNFKGIRAGLGLDELFLDIDTLNEGLIAITGTNGRGKTTVLDNLQPYRLMPFKMKEKKEWSPNAFSYYDQTYGEASKELVFSMGGCKYKSIVLIDNNKRKQEAYLFKEDDGKWNPLNDGKTSTYDVELEAVCGSPTLFFSSAFRGQNARMLSSYPRGEILAIISELLNIDKIRTQSEKSLKVVDALSKDIDVLNIQSGEILKKVSLLPEMEEQKNERAKLLNESKIVLNGVKLKIEESDKLLRNAELTSVSLAEYKKQLIEASLVKKGLSDSLSLLVVKQNKIINDYKVELAQLDSDEKKEVAAIDEIVFSQSKKISEIESLVSEGKSIREKASLLPVLTQQINDKSKAIDELRVLYRNAQLKATELVEMNGECNVLVVKLESAKKEREHKKQNLIQEEATCKKKQEILLTLDCCDDNSGWINEKCPLLADAVAAKNKIPEIVKLLLSLDTLSLEEKELSEKISNLQKKISMLGNPKEESSRYEAEGKSLSAEIKVLNESLTDTQKACLQIAKLDAADSLLCDAKKEYNNLINRKQKSINDFIARKNIIVNKQKDSEADSNAEMVVLQKKIDESDAKVEKIEKGIKEIEVVDISSLQSAKDLLHKTFADLETKMITASENLAKTNAVIEDILKEQKRISEIESRIAVINAEIKNWKIISKACSNDGIIALEIDDAGPSIAVIANDLLASCYGTRFTVRLETQGQKADGSLKEVFDITVFDSERDEVKSLRDMSGGEMTYIEDSITRAIAKFNLQRSDMKYETFFTDEKDGSLDFEKKRDFIKIKRRALETGVHTREIYITQTPELYEFADSQIELSL